MVNPPCETTCRSAISMAASGAAGLTSDKRPRGPRDSSPRSNPRWSQGLGDVRVPGESSVKTITTCVIILDSNRNYVWQSRTNRSETSRPDPAAGRQAMGGVASLPVAHGARSAARSSSTRAAACPARADDGHGSAARWRARPISGSADSPWSAWISCICLFIGSICSDESGGTRLGRARTQRGAGARD